MKKLPAQTTNVNIKLAVLYSEFKEVSPVYLAMEQYSFVYANRALSAKEIMIDTKAAPGNLAIVVMAIEPFTQGKSFPAGWLPAAIIGMGRLKD